MNSCDLQTSLNDTIILRGLYSRCVEYSSFHLKNKDACRDSFDLALNFNSTINFEDFKGQFDQLAGCNQRVELTLRGIARNDKNQYGHLGTNNSEFEVLEILNFGKIKN